MNDRKVDFNSMFNRLMNRREREIVAISEEEQKPPRVRVKMRRTKHKRAAEVRRRKNGRSLRVKSHRGLIIKMTRERGDL
jgi:hypothetical protein